MLKIDEKLAYLHAFRKRNKFAGEAWKERGLQPSDDEICEKLEALFNVASTDLIIALQNNPSNSQLKFVLKRSLRTFDKWDYDTEEKEFICDLMNELAQIVEVKFGNNLNAWLYGYLLMFMLNVSRLLKPEKVHHSYIQSCTNCHTQLEIQILLKKPRSSVKNWIIGKCGSCETYNIFTSEMPASHMKHLNFFATEYLPGHEYSFDDAVTRMEQIQLFRK